nr:MAG TPA: hypothetical protein [Caudoviricetes sp.]
MSRHGAVRFIIWAASSKCSFAMRWTIATRSWLHSSWTWMR